MDTEDLHDCPAYIATRIERANFAGLEMKEGRTGKPYNGTLPFSVSL